MPGNIIQPFERVVIPTADTLTANKINTGAGRKLIVCTLVFILCVAPTIISYRSYLFRWDDSDYLARSIMLSRSFWSGDAHGVRIAMVDIRPPVMMLLALPWGPVTSWSAAGKCFVTLIALTSIFAAFCLFALLRVGINTLYLLIAGIAMFAALGPYTAGPYVHSDATSLLADSLFAWMIFAILLLIPYEGIAYDPSVSKAVMRGILWGALFSAAAITKITCGYFIVLVAPILLVIRTHHSGGRSARIAFASLAATSAPVAFYWLRYGLPALRNGWASSFGSSASFYHVPFWSFVRYYGFSIGMLVWVTCVIAGLAYWIVKGRESARDAKGLPLLILFGYLAIGLMSSNREIRFFFPAIIAPPFLIGQLLSRKKEAVSYRPAVLAAGCAFAILAVLSLPTLHRANKQSIARAEAVLAQAVRSNAKSIVLATDSETLNADLIRLAIVISSHPTITVGGLGWGAPDGLPIEDDFRIICDSDLVVFQNDEALTLASFTNVRVPQYKEYVYQHYGNIPINVVGDMQMFQLRHRSQ